MEGDAARLIDPSDLDTEAPVAARLAGGLSGGRRSSSSGAISWSDGQRGCVRGWERALRRVMGGAVGGPSSEEIGVGGRWP